MDTLKHLSLSLMLLVAATASAQDDEPRSLLGGREDMANGGWGAPTATYTRMLDQDALLVGARRGWLIDHRITLGFAGHGLVTSVNNAASDAHLVKAGQLLRSKSRLQTGYGGLLIEPIIAYRSPVHISLPIIIGAGGAGYSYSVQRDPYPMDEEHEHGTYFDDATAYFVVEPGIDLEVTLIPLVRLAVGASYRFTSDLDLPGTPKDALHGFNAGFSVKVGRF